MRNLILKIVFLLITISSLGQTQNSFEGIITYKVSVNFIENDSPDKEYFEQKYGDTLKVYFNKNGDIFKKIIGSGEYGYDFNLYLNRENNYYAKWKNLDTLYYYNVSEENLTELSRETGRIDDKINYFKIKGIEPNSRQIVTQKFYYTGSPYLNGKLFQKFSDFFTDEYYQLSNSPFLKLELDLGNHIITYEAVKIESKKLDDSIFTFPSSIPKKRY